MARKRIALSVDPEYHELLTQIAKYQNKTITGVVTDFLEASRPTAEAMLKAFEDLYAGKAKTKLLMNYQRLVLKILQKNYERSNK